MFRVEAKWNRAFHYDYVDGGEKKTIEEAIACAKALENSGDGAGVKGTRIVNYEGKVVYICGKIIKPN